MHKTTAYGRVTFTLTDEMGKIVTEKTLSNIVVANGEVYIANRVASATITPLSSIAIGDGTIAPTTSDNALTHELGREAFISGPTQGSGSEANTVSMTASFPAGVSTGTITEAGLFYGSSMFSKILFSPITKGATQALSVTWKLVFVDADSLLKFVGNFSIITKTDKINVTIADSPLDPIFDFSFKHIPNILANDIGASISYVRRVLPVTPYRNLVLYSAVDFGYRVLITQSDGTDVFSAYSTVLPVVGVMNEVHCWSDGVNVYLSVDNETPIVTAYDGTILQEAGVETFIGGAWANCVCGLLWDLSINGATIPINEGRGTTVYTSTGAEAGTITSADVEAFWSAKVAK